jgi:antitoxin MazE
MQARVVRCGDGLALLLPSEVAGEAGLTEGSVVDVRFTAGRVVAIPPGVPTLEELVKGITDENRHDEIDFGPPVGNEVW